MWSRRPDNDPTTAQIAALRTELASLRQLLISETRDQLDRINAMSDTLTTELSAIRTALANLQTAVQADTARASGTVTNA